MATDKALDSLLNQLILELTDASLAADYTRVRRVAGRLAELMDKTDEAAASHLRTIVRKRGVPLRSAGYGESLPVDGKSRLPLVEEQVWPSSPLFIDEAALSIFQSFISDVQHSEVLTAKGLPGRHCLLVSGPPGTGKSLLAGHLAAQLRRPLYVVRLDSMISSLLGDTAKNIRSVFDYVPSREAVLFIDEMDAIAKVRDDRHELGELKRVVNTVIQGLDSLDDNAIVVGATNHPQLLDPAIWRRFPYKIELGPPGEAVRIDLWRHYLSDSSESHVAELLARLSAGLSGADIEMLAHAARRQAILDKHKIDGGAVAAAALDVITGNRATPKREGLTTEERRRLTQRLVRDHDMVQADVARLLGVSRQAVSAYLKEDNGHG